VGFFALGLIAVRNIPPAAIVLAPVVGRALRPIRPGDDAPAASTASRRPVVNLAFLALIGVAAAIFLASAIQGRAIDTDTYPAAALSYMERTGLLRAPHRMAQQDTVGDYVILREGMRARVFIDDRFDMYPARITREYASLLAGSPSSLRILERHHVDVVLWDRSKALVPLLRATGDWRQAYARKGWVVLVRS
jgi:hypothetical protein